MEFHKQAAYENGMYVALAKLGMSMPRGMPKIPPAALKAKAAPAAVGTQEQLRRGTHKAQLGAAPNSPNKSLQVMI